MFFDKQKGMPFLNKQQQSTTLGAIRWFLMAILLMGLLGTGVELLLLEHTEGLWQWVPLLLIAIGLIVLSWGLLYPGRRNIRVLQGTMILFVLSGLVGLILHYEGNAEFELEMYPSLKGLELFWEAIRGATPTLAPGTMIQLGLLGLAYTIRHPQLGSSKKRPSDDKGKS